MTEFDIEMAGYLHDAEIKDISLSIASDGIRTVTISMTCDSDCGYVPWNGQNLHIKFVDALVVNAEFFGYTSNPETLDSLMRQSSAKLDKIIKKLVDCGIGQPRLYFTLSFHSGSSLDIACNEVSLELVE